MAQVHFNFEKKNFNYSLKNIGVPTKMEYLMSLTHQVRSFVDRVRWRAFHILNPTNRESKETFGFNTISSSPKVEALEVFEEKMFNLVKNIEFHRKGNKLQDKLREDQRKINQEERLIIAADKTRNFSHRRFRGIECRVLKICDFKKVIFSPFFKHNIAGFGMLIPKRYHMLG